jgi:rfaE bifunctional protein nucleotidyltransferase chain/domain
METIGKLPSGTRSQKPSKQIWVYCAGVFDLLHFGHIRYLKEAKALGDVLVVGLLTDNGVERYKPHRPILTYEERWEVLKEIKGIDYVVRQEDTDPTETLKELITHGWVFDVMCRGDDYPHRPQGSDFIEANGGRVVRIPYSKEISSTEIGSRIMKVYGR